MILAIKHVELSEFIRGYARHVSIRWLVKTAGKLRRGMTDLLGLPPSRAVYNLPLVQDLFSVFTHDSAGQ